MYIICLVAGSVLFSLSTNEQRPSAVFSMGKIKTRLSYK